MRSSFGPARGALMSARITLSFAVERFSRCRLTAAGVRRRILQPSHIRFTLVTKLAAALLASVSSGCSDHAGANQSSEAAKLAGATNASGAFCSLQRLEILAPTDTVLRDFPVQRVELGTLRRGEQLHRTIMLSNRTSKLATIDRFEISCDCLTITALPVEIPPAAEHRLEFAIDETRDTQFAGDLGVDVIGYNGSRLILRAQVCLSVRP
jgi:hypothetical protein